MTGESIRALKSAVAGVRVEHVEASQLAWLDGKREIVGVDDALSRMIEEVKETFGADSESGVAAAERLRLVRRALRRRTDEMQHAADALSTVVVAMRAAQRTARLAASDPGPAPAPPVATGDEDADRRAAESHGEVIRAHNRVAAGYARDDQEAERVLRELNLAYSEAATVFRGIHGETPGGDGPGTPTSPAPGGPGLPAPPGGVPGPGAGPGTGPGLGPVPGPGPGLGPVPGPGPGAGPGPDGGPYPGLGPHGPYPSGGPGPGLGPSPTGGSGPDGAGSGGGGGPHPALLGGLVAGGLLGAPGLVNGIRSALSGGPGFTRGAGTIGGTTRAGGPGSLGRPGAASAGSPVSRGGAGGRGGAGAAGGRGGAAGAAGGRGAQGGRGGGRGTAGVGGAGGRGAGKRDKDDPQSQELFDDGQDWLDDEGAGPGVLG